MNNDLPDLRAGVYRHWKGPLYTVLGYSHNASADNTPQVLYIGLQLDRAKPGPRFATRDVDDFHATVCTVHGMEWHSIEHERVTVTDRDAGTLNEHFHQHGASRPRFRYLGPVYYAGMETS